MPGGKPGELSPYFLFHKGPARREELTIWQLYGERCVKAIRQSSAKFSFDREEYAGYNSCNKKYFRAIKIEGCRVAPGGGDTMDGYKKEMWITVVVFTLVVLTGGI